MLTYVLFLIQNGAERTEQIFLAHARQNAPLLDIVISWHSLPMLFTVLNKEKDSVPLSYNIQDGGGKG